MKVERVLVVYKKSLYQIYVREHRNVAVKRALRRRDPAAGHLARSHDIQHEAMKSVRQTLTKFGIATTYRWRGQLRSTRGYDLIIAVGGDGTVLDTAHRIVHPIPLLGINSDPGTSIGQLCAGTAADLGRLIEALGSGRLRPRPVNRMRVQVEGRAVLGPCLNDVLFAHRSPAEMSRFEIAVPVDSQAVDWNAGLSALDYRYTRNSGIWIATATGSTAAIHSAGGRPMPRASRRLQYLLREPFSAAGAPAPPRMKGFVAQGDGIVIINRMRSARLWGDGVHRRAVVGYGQRVLIDRHPNPLLLVPRPASW